MTYADVGKENISFERFSNKTNLISEIQSLSFENGESNARDGLKVCIFTISFESDDELSNRDKTIDCNA